jgi:hypothetical protein
MKHSVNNSLLNNNTFELEIRTEHETLYKLITTKSVKMQSFLLNRFDLIVFDRIISLRWGRRSGGLVVIKVPEPIQ